MRTLKGLLCISVEAKFPTNGLFCSFAWLRDLFSGRSLHSLLGEHNQSVTSAQSFGCVGQISSTGPVHRLNWAPHPRIRLCTTWLDSPLPCTGWIDSLLPWSAPHAQPSAQSHAIWHMELLQSGSLTVGEQQIAEILRPVGAPWARWHHSVDQILTRI